LQILLSHEHRKRRQKSKRKNRKKRFKILILRQAKKKENDQSERSSNRDNRLQKKAYRKQKKINQEKKRRIGPARGVDDSQNDHGKYDRLHELRRRVSGNKKPFGGKQNNKKHRGNLNIILREIGFWKQESNCNRGNEDNRMDNFLGHNSSIEYNIPYATYTGSE